MSTTINNYQARTTVGILNTVRWLTVALYFIAVVIGVVGAFSGLVTGNGNVFLQGLIITVISTMFGALSYAFIGWYVDTLNLLTQIAKNTEAGL